MDSWSFNSVVKGFADDESFSTADAFDKNEIGSIGWEVKPPFVFGLSPNEINIDINQLFGDNSFPRLMRNSLFNPVMAASQDNVSCSNIEFNSRESEVFDLKLGRVIDQREAQILKASRKLNLSEASMPSKRPREGGFGSSTPFCKVYGCNKNLSNCKEYHKRHKVCEVHSKTSKVIVNGIEQRFCQQCSRFHVLREFDEGKRSCRKRLAGHNERRRKPHAGVLSEQHGRLFPPYNIKFEGNEFKGSTGAISSFPLLNDLHSLYELKYESSERWQMNLDDRKAHEIQSISCITDEQMHPKSLCPCNLERNPRSDVYIGDSTSISTGLSGIASSSGSSHSLLSSQSQSTTSCHSSRFQPSNSQSQPVWFPGCHCEPTQDSRHFHQHDMNPLVGFESNSFKFAIDGMFRGSKCVNTEDLVFADEGCTIDLLQLSSRLERVEHQMQSSQMNHANGVSVRLGIT